MYKNDCLMYGEVFENVNQAEKWAIQELNNLRQGAQILARLTRPDND